jgi:serine/threonine protein kinase
MQAQRIARELCSLPPLQREEQLGFACGSDTGLRVEVEKRLREFQEQATGSERLIDDLGQRDAPRDLPVEATARGPEPLPERIGRYRVIRKLGQGGFGVVYQAVTDDGLRKVVALKVLRPGVGNPNAVRRFHRERQILPALHHPSIAGFLDADETEDGQPFFVMEYVEGLPLIEYCDRNGLTVRERLALFERICDAVQHAHERFILHRDLKPSNILVDRAGEPKLLDFGIARFLARDAEAAADLATIGDEFAMTPEYASPEQLRGDPLTVGSDVYSLGVILYELLTGHRPYQLKSRVREAASKLVEETRIIPPSVKVGTTEELQTPDCDAPSTTTVDPTSVATRRGTSASRLRGLLVGDIDNIILTSLRREPIRRYASARELVDDLRRHQTGQPVKARGDAWTYRATKFLRRHRVGVGAAIVVLLAAAISAAMAVQAADARAALAAIRVKAAQSDAQEAADYLTSLASRKAGESAVDRQASLEIARLALDRVASVGGTFEDEVRRAENQSQIVELLSQQLTAASSGSPGERERALAEATRAVTDWKAIVDRADEPARWVELASAYRRRAKLNGIARDDHEAGRDLAEAARLLDQLGDRAGEPGDVCRSECLLEEAKAKQRAGAKSAVIADQLLAAERALVPYLEGPLPSAEVLDTAAQVATQLGFVEQAPTKAALEHYRRALAFTERIEAPNARQMRRRIDALQWVSRTERDLGMFREAQEHLDRYQAELRAFRVPNAEARDRMSSLSRGLEQQAHLSLRQALATDAAGAYAKAIEALEVAQEFAGGMDLEIARRIAQLCVAKGDAEVEAGTHANADQSYARAASFRLEDWRKSLKPMEAAAVHAAAVAGQARVAALRGQLERADEYIAIATREPEDSDLPSGYKSMRRMALLAANMTLDAKRGHLSRLADELKRVAGLSPVPDAVEELLLVVAGVAELDGNKVAAGEQGACDLVARAQAAVEICRSSEEAAGFLKRLDTASTRLLEVRARLGCPSR